MATGYVGTKVEVVPVASREQTPLASTVGFERCEDCRRSCSSSESARLCELSILYRTSAARPSTAFGGSSPSLERELTPCASTSSSQESHSRRIQQVGDRVFLEELLAQAGATFSSIKVSSVCCLLAFIVLRARYPGAASSRWQSNKETVHEKVHGARRLIEM